MLCLMLLTLRHVYSGGHHHLVAGKRNHATAYLNVVSAQFGKFLCQYLFQPLEGLGDEFKSLHCRYLFMLYAV